MIEVYKKDVDRALLRENMKLTVRERLENFKAFMRFTSEMREAGRSIARGSENES